MLILFNDELQKSEINTDLKNLQWNIKTYIFNLQRTIFLTM